MNNHNKVINKIKLFKSIVYTILLTTLNTETAKKRSLTELITLKNFQNN